MSLIPRALTLAVLAAAVLPAYGFAPRMALDSLEVSTRKFGIRPAVTASDYPGHDAVVLLDRVHNTIDSTDKVVRDHHRMVKLLRGNEHPESGVRLLLPLAPDLSVVARTVSPTGESVYLATSDFHLEPVRSAAEFTIGSQVLTFTFPTLEPGAILEYAIRYTDDEGMEGDAHIFDDELPVQVGQYALGSQKGFPFQPFPFDARTGQPFAVKSRSPGLDSTNQPILVETWELRDLPGLEPESQAIGELKSHAHLLLVRGIRPGEEDHWARFARILIRTQESSRYILDDQRLAVQKLVSPLPTATDKTFAVLRYLRSRLRIQHGRPISDHSLTMDEIFAGGVVDPNRFTLFLAALLRQAGLSAYIGFANSSNAIQLDRRVPWTGFFDRLLVVVVADGKTLFFDPRVPDMETGVPRADCQGRTALVARWASAAAQVSDNELTAPVEARFFDIPYQPPASNTTERRVQVVLTKDGDAKVSYDESRTGEPALAIHDGVRWRGSEATRLGLAEELAAALPGVDIATVTMSSAPRAATVRGSWTTGGLTLQSPSRIGIDLSSLSPARKALLDLALPAPSQRHSGIDLGYPEVLRTVASIQIPAGTRLGALPKAAAVDGPGLKYAVTYRTIPGGAERVSTFTQSVPTIGRESLAAFERFLAEALRAESQTLVIAR